MEWAQTLTIVGTNIVILGSTVTLFLWARSEANTDRRDLNARADADRREVSARADADRKEANERADRQITAIREDIRDFHARLCVIEERRNRILMGEK
jgi:hypothetical protein